MFCQLCKPLTETPVTEEDGHYTIEEPHLHCPNCGTVWFVDIAACRIMRCGIEKTTKQQIPPHASKEYCDNLVANNLLYSGCAKPLHLDVNNCLVISSTYD